MDYKLAAIALSATITLGGCASVNLWPFGDSKQQQQSNAPANSNEYRCAGGKKFYVRLIDNGNAAWLILPDREVSLAKTGAGAAVRYSNGISTLAINGREATLELSAGNSYADCKLAGK